MANGREYMAGESAIAETCETLCVGLGRGHQHLGISPTSNTIFSKSLNRKIQTEGLICIHVYVSLNCFLCYNIFAEEVGTSTRITKLNCFIMYMRKFSKRN